MTATLPSLPQASGARAGAVPTVAVDQIGDYVPPISDVLITGGGLDGIAPRLRVDVGQTGFFAGREFRSFKNLVLTNGQVYVIRLSFVVNTIVFSNLLDVTSGDVTLENVSGGTPGGSFSETLPVYPRNAMTERPSPVYAAQNALTAGGTLAGGLVTDVLQVKAADNSNFAATVGGEQGDERGAPPGTYYYRLTANAASTAVWRFRWEERP